MNRSPRFAKPIAAVAGMTVATVILAACSSSGSGTTAAAGSSSAPLAPASSAAAPVPASSAAAASPGPASEAPASSAPAVGAAAAAVVSVKSGPLGSYLTDGAGRTLYLYTPDETSASTCYGGCATAWPPLTTAGAPTATAAAAAGTLATSKRTDGSLQVTYDGHPLYYFKADSAPGDTKGQGVAGSWFEVAPGGRSIGAPAALVVPKESAAPTSAAAGGWS